MNLDFSDFLIRHAETGDFDGLHNARMAAYFTQKALCYVTGLPLRPYRRQLHHRRPRHMDGDDAPQNLVLLHIDVHKLVHSHDSAEIQRLTRQYLRTDFQFRILNQLRFEAGMKAIPQVCMAA